MTPAPESVAQVLAEVREWAQLGAGYLLPSAAANIVARLEAALARESTPARRAFVEAAMAYAEVANRLPGQPALVPEADEKWRAFNAAYRAMLASEAGR